MYETIVAVKNLLERALAGAGVNAAVHNTRAIKPKMPHVVVVPQPSGVSRDSINNQYADTFQIQCVSRDPDSAMKLMDVLVDIFVDLEPADFPVRGANLVNSEVMDDRNTTDETTDGEDIFAGTFTVRLTVEKPRAQRRQ